jgi:hypothetical protein
MLSHLKYSDQLGVFMREAPKPYCILSVATALLDSARSAHVYR